MRGARVRREGLARVPVRTLAGGPASFGVPKAPGWEVRSEEDLLTSGGTFRGEGSTAGRSRGPGVPKATFGLGRFSIMAAIFGAEAA